MTSLLITEESDANFNEPQPTLVAADFDANTLVAELTEEEILELKQELLRQDREHEEVETRQIQQQAIIETQAEQIARLKREAAALKEAEAERQAKEQAAQEYFMQRLKSKESAK